MPSFTPITKSHAVHREAARLPARFTLDGANDPSVFGGAVLSVARLATAAPVIFYRVTLDRPYRLVAQHTVISASVRPNTAALAAAQIGATVIAGNLTDAGGASFDGASQFDVVISAGGVAVDTAGLVVDVDIALDLHTPPT